MTVEQIKEQLSKAFLFAIASRLGCIVRDENLDLGVDVTIQFPFVLNRNQRKRFLGAGKSIYVQLKTTTMSHIVVEKESIKYDLEVKNFNDFIDCKDFRKEDIGEIPLILVLFILPDDPNEWLIVKEEELILRKFAFWYYPAEDAKKSTNKYKTRIRISKSKRITLDSFPEIFDYFFK
ncbi:MAG: DUF4365 domain-containing protein [Chitinophagales bacterium]